MATNLDKDLIRETTIFVDGRAVLITLGADQKVTMKLKGMKTGAVSIGIEDLYKYLIGSGAPSVGLSIPAETKKRDSDGVMMSLHDIRHRSNIRGWDYTTTVKFDNMLSELLEETSK